MRHFVLFTILACSAPTWATTEPGCEPALGQGSEYIPTAPDLVRLAEKVAAISGEDKFFQAIDGGNRGTHIYLIPHRRAAHALAVAARFPGGWSADKLAEIYDPSSSILVGILETEDEPLLTLAVFHREPGSAPLSRKFNVVDVTETDQVLRKLVPDAFAGDDYDGFHLLWDILRDDQEVEMPGIAPHVVGSWSIESYRASE
jgi:hypothetical protein